MTANESGAVKTKGMVYNALYALGRFITEPPESAGVEQRLRIRLLAAYYLLAAVYCLGAALFYRQADIRIFYVLMPVCVVLAAGYALSRSKYYRAALAPAVIVPAVPSIVIALFQPPGVNILSWLMGLSLPLLAAGLLFSPGWTHLAALAYALAGTALALAGLLSYPALGVYILFLFTVVFFSVSFAALRKDDLSVIANQVAGLEEAKKTLKESEEKYRGFFQLAKDAIIITDFETGVIIDANTTASVLTGIPREKLIGKEHVILFPPGTGQETVHRFTEHADEYRNRAYSDDVILQRPDGTRIQASVTNTFFRLKGRETTQSIYRDMTERVAMEKQLRDSEEVFSKAFQSSPNAISISEFGSGAFIAINDAYTRITGFTREELLGKSADEFKMWGNVQDRDKMISAATRRIRLLNEEVDFRSKSGEIRNMLISTDFPSINGRDCFMLTAMDITEYKQTQKALGETKERLEKIIDLSPQQLLITRLEDGGVIQFNETFTRVTGFSDEDLSGQTSTGMGVWMRPEDRDRLLQELKKTGRVDNMEFDFRTKSGKVLTELLSCTLLEVNGEQCILSIITDITERKEMERSLRVSQEKFSRTFHAIPDPVAITRIKDGAIMDVNKCYADIVRLPREKILGHTPQELGFPDPENRTRWIMDTVLKQGSISDYEFALNPENPDTGYVLFSADLTEIGGEPYMISIMKDISQQKKAEKALRESEEKFSKTFKAIPESVTISRVKDSLFIDVNDTFCVTRGCKAEDIIGHTAEELGLWVNVEQRDELIKEIREHGAISNKELDFVLLSGEVQTTLLSADIVNISGEPCLIVISNDITERKKMEKALKISEEKFSKAFQAIPEHIVIYRIKDSMFIDVNDNFARFNGLTREQIIGRRPEEIPLQNAPVHPEELIATVRREGGIINREIVFQEPQNSIQAALFSARIIDIAGEPCMIAISTDISERKRMEQALKESEEKFSKAFHSIPEAVSIIRAGDGVFMDVNDAFCQYARLSHDQILGHTGDELNIPDEGGYVANSIQEVKRGVKVNNREIVYFQDTDFMTTILLSADLLEINGEPCIITIANNITPLKKIEMALRESEEKFSRIFRLSPQMIVINRIKDGQVMEIMDANESFTRKTGYTLEECVGKTTLELGIWRFPEDRAPIAKEAVETGHVYDREVEFVIKSGDILTCLLSMGKIEVNGEECTVSIITDITERKQAEEKLKMTMVELKLSTVQLKATNKELESFSYSVSHDLRSPLRSIDGFSQALMEDYGPRLDDTAVHYLQRLRGASQKMGELIDGLLKLSRLTRGEMHFEEVDLSAMAEEIAQRLRETDRHRSVEFVIEKGAAVNGDRQMLRAMMENLLNNAWKFTQKQPQAKIEFGSTILRNKKTYFIRDNGAGFDMAFADKLFGAFQRLHNEKDFSGTGIGLATVQRIINRHGGSIRGEGAVDQGAVFYFTL